jgi:DNA (cytosine-5)-methyltransferase 1
VSSSQGDSTPKKKALDLFCCAGGASEGLHRAGFVVVGVDIVPQPDYPFEFILADALSVPLEGYDFIWASPPCKAHTSLRYLPNSRDKKYPDLVTPTRKLLRASGKPYVIENVPPAPLRKDLLLCGSMFGLGTADGKAELQRHRIFEVGGFPVPPQPECVHGRRPVIGVYGRSGGGYDRRGQRDGVWGIHPRFKSNFYPVPQCGEAMGIDWMRMESLSQAVPPAYSLSATTVSLGFSLPTVAVQRLRKTRTTYLSRPTNCSRRLPRV